ncbi:response regulator transcription factor [Pseudorhodoferax sp. Leaf265]|uniref:response regulator transcription factor n=1 Tax=Pseudorhodoferax sp. Leaf265 TaxID=1736315 RepID=UPI0007023248|nr:response regulator transcription factor [Pseudorhodoferax sp. Leaf265]KQP12372.1 two-component system response regulator [Pseudorhodoferax sp. Leaf265]
MKILVVEDEADLAQVIASSLRRQQWVVDLASSLAEAELLALEGSHDVIVLDRGLPDGDGLDLVSTLKSASIAVPVLVLTAMSDVADRVRSLDHGADDYLAKPFAIDELLARLRALVRRPALRSRPPVVAGHLSWNPETRQVVSNGIALALPRRELLVLETLMQHRGRTVLRGLLLSRVFGESEEIRSNTLDAHVSRLRAKLEELSSGVEIHSIRGVGYLLRSVSR